jgi:opacity protein-like surface antigen
MQNASASRSFGLRASAVGFLLAAILCPSAARADATFFLGSTLTPHNRLARGAAIGVSLLVVGFEFEYSNTSEDEDTLSPSLITGMGNVLVQLPGSFSPYGTIGGGFYRERLGQLSSETHFGSNVGGGVKITLAGPLRVRFDYRLFSLQGNPRESKSHRFYAGLNLMF